ncbi:MAG TPA: hypothetical protein ENI51_06145, partial [Candidatus Atribacteria bacterium]|nr:hypothetical protein [Candidatus Atribacteria bacterium]
MKDIVYSQTGCQFEQELHISNPILLEDANVDTIVIGNFLSRIGNKDRKELIYGTFDSRIMILNAVSLRCPFSIETNSTVKGIRLEDIESSDDEIKYNELISWDVNNTLYVHNKDLDLLFEEKIEYPIVDVTFLDADNNNEKDVIVATKNDIRAIDNKGELIWQNTRFCGIEEILTVNFIEQEQNKIEEIVAKTENKILIYGFNGGFIKSIDFAPGVIKDLEIWKEQGDKLLVLTQEESKFRIHKISERDELTLPYKPEKIIKKLTPINTDIYSRNENSFVILWYENKLEVIDPTKTGENNEPIWVEEFENSIINVENFDLEKHFLNEINEGDYYSLINDNKEIIVTTNVGDIFVYYYHYDQDEGEISCYSKSQKNKKIEEIAFSTILDVDKYHYVSIIQVLKNNETYLLELFRQEFGLINDYKNGISAFEQGDYKWAKRNLDNCIKNENRKITEEYYKFYDICDEKLEKIKEIAAETKSKTVSIFEDGIKFLNIEDYPSAVEKLFEAYKRYENAGFDDDKEDDGDDIIYEDTITIENIEFDNVKLWDLRGILFYLDLSILKKANTEFKKENYEFALENFIIMYPSFAYFNWYIDGILSNYKDFIEKFSEDVKEVRENYNAPDHIKTNIDKCFEELETGALSLMEEDKYTDAKSQYEKLDVYREEMGEKEDSEKRTEYKEKIKECDEKIRDIRLKWTILSIIIISAITLAYHFILRHFIRKKRRKEKTSAGFHLKIDEIEKNLEFDVTY